MQDLVPQLRIEPMPSALGMRSRNHWTVREAPSLHGCSVCQPDPALFLPPPLLHSPLWSGPRDPSKQTAKPRVVSELLTPDGEGPACAVRCCLPGGFSAAPSGACSRWSPWESHAPAHDRTWRHRLVFWLDIASGTQPDPSLRSAFHCSPEIQTQAHSFLQCSPGPSPHGA